ncbi:Tas retrotransposon peptidase A16, partial [Ostertagia ostertagi]
MSAKDKRKRIDSADGLCLFCKGDHKPSFCTTYSTPRERAKYLRDQRLCQLCASSYHKTTECRRKPCFRCGGPHHTACCFKTLPIVSSTERGPQKRQEGDTKKVNQKEKRPMKTTQKINMVTEEGHKDGSETTILEVQSAQELREYSTTFLPIGEIKVVDNKTGGMRNIPVLLDSGAEISFIDKSLAEDLQVPIVSERSLLLHTFGSEEIQKKKCRVVRVSVQDTEGNGHDLELLTHEVLTKPMRPPPLFEEDLQVIESLGLSVTQPLILLGCDQAWQFWKADEPPVPLPSGLHLLPTKVGNLITGRYRRPQQVLEVQSCRE